MPTLTYTGGTGLFDKLGAIFYSQQKVVDHITNLRTRRTTIASKYTAAQYPWIDNALNQLDAWIAMCVEQLRGYQADAQTTLIEYVHSLIPLPSKTVAEALKILRREMIADGYKIAAPSVYNYDATQGIVGTAASGNTGNGKAIIFSGTHDSSHQVLHIFWPAETVTAECISATTSSTEPRLELWRVTGQSKRDGMDPDWPGGSGINLNVPAMSAYFEQQTAIGRNVLKGSSFDAFTASVPDYWENAAALGGVAGVDYLAAGAGYIGANALRLNSAGGIRQRLNSGATAGSLGQFIQQWQYIGVVAAKLDLAGSDTGLFVDLCDSGGSTLFGMQMNPTVDTTAYALHHHIFRTPASIPSEIYARVYNASAPDKYADQVMIAPMIPLLGSNGPFIAIAQGSTPAAVGDRFTFSVTNAGDAVFAKWFQRNFDMLALGVALPITGATAISDALVA